jgi:hypothetical protein
MRKYKVSISLVYLISILFSSIVFCSCSSEPAINSFRVTLNDTAEVRRMTADDTLRVHWDVKGTPALLINETELPDSAGRVLQLKLVVQNGGREANRIAQVEILPKSSATTITFATKLSANGDTLIAEGNKNPGGWGNRFEILSVSNASDRALMVWHSGQVASLNKEGSASDAFAGSPVEGRWVFKSLLTPSEKRDHSALPERLQVNVSINYKRR